MSALSEQFIKPLDAKLGNRSKYYLHCHIVNRLWYLCQFNWHYHKSTEPNQIYRNLSKLERLKGMNGQDGKCVTWMMCKHLQCKIQLSSKHQVKNAAHRCLFIKRHLDMRRIGEMRNFLQLCGVISF